MQCWKIYSILGRVHTFMTVSWLKGCFSPYPGSATRSNRRRLRLHAVLRARGHRPPPVHAGRQGETARHQRHRRRVRDGLPQDVQSLLTTHQSFPIEKTRLNNLLYDFFILQSGSVYLSEEQHLKDASFLVTDLLIYYEGPIVC